MNSTLAFFDQHELGFHDSSDGPITFVRRAARAVLHNADGEVALMYFTTTGSYKLPGGGIDEGESLLDALRREVREEAGYEVHDIKELGMIDERRYICGMQQLSYCFTATVGKYVGTDLTEEERARGMELVWLKDIDQAISAVESGTKPDEGLSVIELEMMKLREVTILRVAKNSQQ